MTVGQPPRGALDGVRVLDLSRVLAGPYCTMLLGDLGADVIKVEQPGKGDDTRAWGPPWAGGESAYYLAVNRNKRSLTVDLKQPAGQEIVRELASASDIVVENFRLGTLERLGLGYEQLRELNPRLIWATISGYGPDGPDADRPGYDFVAQGEAGIMAITGEPDGEPIKVGVAIVDITTGMYTAISILAALRARDASGVGQRIDASLLSSAVAWLANVGQNHLVSGQPATRYGNAHANIVPYQVFHARDQYITIAVGNDKQFQAFCGVLGQPELASDPRFLTNPARVEHRDELIPLIQGIVETRDAADLLADCRAAGIPSGPINSVEQVFKHPQVLARNMVLEVTHPTAGALKLAGIPFELAGTPASVRLAPPLLGQHTNEILRERLGKSADEIARLRASGALDTPLDAPPVARGASQGAAPSRVERTSRDTLYETIAVALLNAGVRQPAAEFVSAVRQRVGFRAAPRQIATAVEELTRAGQIVDADAAAGIVQGLRGAGAERQRRHADEWRALGAALALRGLDGTPAGQRAFVGTARRVAGRAAGDALILNIALTVASEGRALDPEIVGKVAKRLSASAPDLTSDQLTTLAQRALRDLDRPQRKARTTQRSSSAARRPPPPSPRSTDVRTRKPGKRRWAPGGRRRRTIRFPEQETE